MVDNPVNQLRIVPDERSAEEFLDGLAAAKGVQVVSFLNANALNLAWSDGEFAAHLAASDSLLRDGIGVNLFLRLFRRSPGINTNGTDLIPRLVSRFDGRRVAVCGTEEPYLGRAVQKISELGADVVLAMDGFLEIEDYVDELSRVPSDLIILAMGMPRQERIAATLRGTLPYPCVIVNGGAILDFMAGRVSRAPRWMQVAGLEWAYRLAREPRRLWRRYLLGNVIFMTRAIAMRFGVARNPAWGGQASAAGAQQARVRFARPPNVDSPSRE